jgi:hypothetical protein
VFQITVRPGTADQDLIPLWQELMHDDRFAGLVGARNGGVIRFQYRSERSTPAPQIAATIQETAQRLGIDARVDVA